MHTIILMIPLQIMMIGLRWQLIIVVVIVFMLLAAGWQQLNKYDWRQAVSYTHLSANCFCRGLLLLFGKKLLYVFRFFSEFVGILN